ncbi:MAG: VanW family protein [Candidatus Obscuribacter sp.]|nr:VanW family protein [Candidatus Obscuribacter sp.]
MKSGQRKSWQKPGNIFLALLIPALLTFHFATHPFATELAGRSINLSAYSAPHRQNFASALARLDGTVIKPGQTFSFNQRLGERTSRGGYVPAPGYLGNDRFATSGGGICLISSNLYQLALLSGLDIVERSNHVRPVSSVAPGLDATVWYGSQDLRLKNNLPYPVEISSRIEGNFAYMKILGKAGLKPIKRRLERKEIARDNRTCLVEVYLLSSETENGSPETRLVSRDCYRIGR